MTGARVKAWTSAALLATIWLTACSSTDRPTASAQGGEPSAGPTSIGRSPTGAPDPDVAVAMLAPRLRDGLLETTPLDYDRSTCVAEHLVDHLGPADAVELAGAKRIGRLSPRQRSGVSAGLDACLPSALVARGQATGIAEALGLPGPPDEDMVRCFAEAFEGRVGDLVLSEQGYEPGDTPPRFVAEAIGGCTPGDLWIDLLAAEFREPGLSVAEARCAGGFVLDQLGPARLIALSGGEGHPPAPMMSAIQGAVDHCLTSGA